MAVVLEPILMIKLVPGPANVTARYHLIEATRSILGTNLFRREISTKTVTKKVLRVHIILHFAVVDYKQVVFGCRLVI